MREEESDKSQEEAGGSSVSHLVKSSTDAVLSCKPCLWPAFQGHDDCPELQESTSCQGWASPRVSPVDLGPPAHIGSVVGWLASSLSPSWTRR